MRKRGERIERSFAHLYDSGGMRRTHLRGHTNILKRLLIHAGGFNLGLVMRHLLGSGTPRGLKHASAILMPTLCAFLGATRRWLDVISAWHPLMGFHHHIQPLTAITPFSRSIESSPTYTTGC